MLFVHNKSYSFLAACLLISFIEVAAEFADRDPVATAVDSFKSGSFLETRPGDKDISNQEIKFHAGGNHGSINQ